MYRYAFQLFRLYWPVILLVSAFMYLVEVWGKDRWSLTLVPSLIAYAYLVFLFHVTLLKGIPLSCWGTGTSLERPGKRFWIAYLFPFVSFVLAAFVFAAIIKHAFPAEVLSPNAAMGYAILLSLGSLGILLASFGTMIPAATVGSSVGFSAALKRARKSFWFVLWRLITGPVLFFVGFVVLISLLEKQGLLPPFPDAFSSITVSNAAWNISLNFLGTFSSALAVAIFSMAYLWVEEERSPKILGREP